MKPERDYLEWHLDNLSQIHFQGKVTWFLRRLYLKGYFQFSFSERQKYHKEYVSIDLFHNGDQI